MSQLLAGAVGVVGHVGAVVLVETDSRDGVELGLDGFGPSAWASWASTTAAACATFAVARRAGIWAAGMLKSMGGSGMVATAPPEDDELVVGGGDSDVGFNAGGTGVGDGAVDGVALEAEDDEVLLGDEELVKGDVDERTIEGDSGQARVVDSVRRLATAARDEVEGPDELLGLVDGVDAKGMMERDHV